MIAMAGYLKFQENKTASLDSEPKARMRI